MSNSRESWYRKHRPTIETYVYESQHHYDTVKLFMEQGHISGNLLLSGDPGTGKTSLSNIIADTLYVGSNNVIRLDDMRVESIRNLIPKLQTIAIGYNVVHKNEPAKKLIIFEEADKLLEPSNLLLKTGLLENYQDTVSFIFNTNNKDALDPAILSRFNHKLDFTGVRTEHSIGNTILRCVNILAAEGIAYDPASVEAFVKDRSAESMRGLVVLLEAASTSGRFTASSVDDLSDVALQASEEFEVVQLIQWIVYTLTSLPNITIEMRNTAYTCPSQSIIKDYHIKLMGLVNQTHLEYNLIYTKLYATVSYAPVFSVLHKYMNGPKVKHEGVKFNAFLSELILACI